MKAQNKIDFVQENGIIKENFHENTEDGKRTKFFYQIIKFILIIKAKRNTMNVISCFTKLFFDTNGQLNSRCLISKQWLMPTEHGKQMIE